MLTTMHTMLLPLAGPVLGQVDIDIDIDDETGNALDTLFASDLWTVVTFAIALVGFGLALYLIISGFFFSATTKNYKKGWVKILAGVLIGGLALNFALVGNLFDFGGTIVEVIIDSMAAFFDQF